MEVSVLSWGYPHRYHPLGDERPKDKKAADASPSDTSLVPGDPMVELDLVSWFRAGKKAVHWIHWMEKKLVGGDWNMVNKS